MFLKRRSSLTSQIYQISLDRLEKQRIYQQQYNISEGGASPINTDSLVIDISTLPNLILIFIGVTDKCHKLIHVTTVYCLAAMEMRLTKDKSISL